MAKWQKAILAILVIANIVMWILALTPHQDKIVIDHDYYDCYVIDGETPTVWDVIKDYYPESIDTWKMVYEIQDINDLDANCTVRGGQLIYVPKWHVE